MWRVKRGTALRGSLLNISSGGEVLRVAADVDVARILVDADVVDLQRRREREMVYVYKAKVFRHSEVRDDVLHSALSKCSPGVRKGDIPWALVGQAER